MRFLAVLSIGLVIVGVSPSFAETQVYFSPEGGCEEHAVALVDSAKKNLDVAVYSLNSPGLVEAIQRAKSRGVAVRVLTDRTQAFGQGNVSATMTLAAALTDFRVHTKNRIMHNKFAVADNVKIMLGSFNWTRSAEHSNDENCLFSDELSTVQAYQKRFNEHLWVINTAEKSAQVFAKMKLKKLEADQQPSKDKK